MMGDIIMLAVIFGALIAVCIVLAWLNNRDGETRDMTCEACGGDEIYDVEPGHGLIRNRMIVRCLDCGNRREVE